MDGAVLASQLKSRAKAITASIGRVPRDVAVLDEPFAGLADRLIIVGDYEPIVC